MKNKSVLLLALVLAGAAMLSGSEPTKLALPSLAAQMVPLRPNGEFVVSVLRQGRWQEVGRLPGDRFLREQRLDLAPWLQGERQARVRIRQQGGGASHLDAVLLDGSGPLSARDGERSKLGRLDNDLTTSTGRTVDLTFAQPAGKNHRLSLTGRIEDKVIPSEPFQFPLQNTFRQPSPASSFYSYRLGSAAPPRHGFAGRAWLDEVGQRRPFFSVLAPTGTGHPTGTTYGWVSNDERNLYVTIDFTPDNTYDHDKDYAKVYVRGSDGLREFKVSVPERRWGKAHFVYTDKAAYQHKVYDFAIPLAGLPRNADGGLDLSFAAYGTASPLDNVTIKMAFDPNQRRYLAVISAMGDVVGAFIDEDGNLIGSPLFIAGDGGDACFNPDVAFDTVNRRFMVIWLMTNGDDGTSALAGQMYSDDGGPYNPGMTIAGTADRMYSPARAFDDVHQRYLVAWVVSDDSTYSRVGGQLRDSDGSVVGEIEIPISPPSAFAETVDLAFDSLSQLYMVVWDNRSGSVSPASVSALPAGDQIAARMVSCDGALVGEPFGVTSGTFANWMPAIANDSVNHRFLVAYVQLPGVTTAPASIRQRRERPRAQVLAPYPSTEVIVAGQLLDRWGALQGDAFGIGLRPNAVRFWPQLAFDPVHRRYLAIWHDVEFPSTPGPLVSSAVGQFLGSGGAPLETDPAENFLIGGDSIFYFPMGLACNTVCGNFLVGWLNDSGGDLSVFGGGCPLPPTVATLPITTITTTAAQGGGNVTRDGGTPVFSRGVCWNTAGSPTIHDPHSSDGSGTGTFASSLTGLLPGTTYHVRAYASNSAGTAYGNEVVFTTFRWQVTFLAENGGLLAGATPQYVNDGGNCTPVTATAKAGFFFRKWDGDNGAGTQANPLTVTHVTSDLTFTARFGALGLTVKRRVEQAWIIRSEYAHVEISVSGLADSGAAKFLLFRKEAGGNWEAHKEILPGDFADGHFTFASMPLDQGKAYSFRVEAYSAAGTLLGSSVEVTI